MRIKWLILLVRVCLCPPLLSYDESGDGSLSRRELSKLLHRLKRGAPLKQHHVLLFMSFVDVDDR